MALSKAFLAMCSKLCKNNHGGEDTTEGLLAGYSTDDGVELTLYLILI